MADATPSTPNALKARDADSSTNLAEPSTSSSERTRATSNYDMHPGTRVPHPEATAQPVASS